MFGFAGRPRGRKVDSRPWLLAVAWTHAAEPYGAPRAMQFRIDSSSLNVNAALTKSSHGCGRGAGPTLNQLGRSSAVRAHISALDHRQFSAFRTHLARKGFRSA